jgi:Tol biopolymer transport system component
MKTIIRNSNQTNMKQIVLILILSLGPLIMAIGQEQQAGKLLSKAIYQEEVNGELDEAIKTYQLIVQQYPNNRKVSAEALLHLGICYEKIGMPQAYDTYQDIIFKYSEQKDEVVIARERLSRYRQLSDKHPNTELDPKFTKIQIPTKPGNGVLSPDGDKLAFVSEGCLWLVPVHGKSDPNIAGEPARLTPPMGAWDLANIGMVWSANSKWIAFRAAKARENKNAAEEIYVISASGGDAKKVNINLEVAVGSYGYRIGLSPDGKNLAFAAFDKEKGKGTHIYGWDRLHIYTVGIDGEIAAPLTEPFTREPVFSPDGSQIAYVKINPNNNLGEEIWVISAKGGKPTLVCSEADVIVKSPVWSPDGKMIAFLSRKYKKGYANESNELWIVPVSENGNRKSKINKIKLPVGTTYQLAGWSNNHKIGVLLPSPRITGIYTVPSTGGKSVRLTTKPAWMPCWSPDGQRIYFDGLHTDDMAGIEFIPAQGGEVKRLPIQSDKYVQPSGPTSGTSVSPDGSMIVFSGWYPGSTDVERTPGSHIMLAPVNGGKLVQLTENPHGDTNPCWAPDGKLIAFTRAEQKQIDEETVSFWNIYVIPSQGGAPKRITSALPDKVYGTSIDWSPDGKWIAYYSHENEIRIIPAEGGKSRVVVDKVKHNYHFGLSWSPDSKKIAYISRGKLFIVSLDGGDPQEIQTGLDATHLKMDWSSDGKKIVFGATQGGEHELWLMEGFLPKTEAKN